MKNRESHWAPTNPADAAAGTDPRRIRQSVGENSITARFARCRLPKRSPILPAARTGRLKPPHSHEQDGPGMTGRFVCGRSEIRRQRGSCPLRAAGSDGPTSGCSPSQGLEEGA